MNIRQLHIYQWLGSIKLRYQYKKKISPIIKHMGQVEHFSIHTDISTNTVVIIEPNSFHAETLPGYVKYFLDLGYHVDVFITYENAVEYPFARMHEEFRVFVGGIYDVQDWLRMEKMNEYTAIFFSTQFYKNIIYLPSSLPSACHDRIFCIDHSVEKSALWAKDEPLFWKLRKMNHVATLSQIDGFYRINPNYFGNVKVPSKHSDHIRFVTVGAIKSCFKNHNLLLDSVRGLLLDGITDFSIHVVGAGSMDIPVELQPYIKLCGRLDFPSMYSEVEEADYILALLDPTNQDHLNYKKGMTSGALQLSYGFTTPLLISQEFASAYHLESNAAVIYEGNELLKAMKIAIACSLEDYAIMQACLEKKTKDIFNSSIDSIRRMLN